MKWVLLMAHWPVMPEGPAGDGIRAEWSAAQVRFGEVEARFPEIVRLRAGVWQIRLDNGLNALVALHQALNIPEWNSYGYRTLFFAEEPKWIETMPPTTS